MKPALSASVVAIAAAIAAATPAAAQTYGDGAVIGLDRWNQDDLYTGGISLERLMDDADVHGPTGEDIGSVENVLIGPDGRVLSIIAEVGGFWDIGDTHVNVPWSEVQISADRVVIPVTEETIDDYSSFADETITAADATGSVTPVDDDADTTARVWRVTDLIGDYARLRDGDGYINYGYVNDVIVRDGMVSAVVVEPNSTMWGNRGYAGPYAYPYYGVGYGWNPGANYYDLPYGRNELGDRQPLDYGRFGG